MMLWEHLLGQSFILPQSHQLHPGLITVSGYAISQKEYGYTFIGRYIRKSLYSHLHTDVCAYLCMSILTDICIYLRLYVCTYIQM